MVVFVVLPIIGKLVSQRRDNRIGDLGFAFAVCKEIRAAVAGVIFRISRICAGCILLCNLRQIVLGVLCRCDDIAAILTHHRCIGCACGTGCVILHIAVRTAILTQMRMVQIAASRPLGCVGIVILVLC